MLKMKSLVKTAAFVATAFAATAFADDSAQSVQVAQLTDGFNAQTTYMASCFACHSTGAAGAPKVGPGNKEVWDSRLEKGLDATVANSINGIGSMPAKGLCFTCTDADLRAIVEYMITASSE